MNDREEIKKALNEVLEERHGIDSKTHSQHHKFIEALAEEYRIKKERREAIKTRIIGFGVITTITSFLGAIGYAVTQWIKH